MPNPQNVRRSHPTETVHGTNPKKKSRPLLRFRPGFIVFIWIFCFVACFAAYMISRNLHPELAENQPTASSVVENSVKDNNETSENPVQPEESSVAPVESTPDESSQVVVSNKINPVPESAQQTTEYLAKAAFCGDATTYRFLTNGLLGADNVFASEALNLENYRSTYFDYQGDKLLLLSILRAANCPIYLMFGTETLASISPEQASAMFSDLVDNVKAVAPESKVFILSIPPVTASAEKLKKPILNSNIDIYNSKLLEIANTANVYFVDTNTALKNNEGRLDTALAEDDGIHLNAEGQTKLINYILSHVPQD